MRACGCVLAVVIVLIPPAIRAADDDADHVRRLVARLASPDFRER